MSAPAEKAEPAPVSTRARVRVSAPTRLTVSCNASTRSGLNALRASGRPSVIVTTCRASVSTKMRSSATGIEGKPMAAGGALQARALLAEAHFWRTGATGARGDKGPRRQHRLEAGPHVIQVLRLCDGLLAGAEDHVGLADQDVPLLRVRGVFEHLGQRVHLADHDRRHSAPGLADLVVASIDHSAVARVRLDQSHDS